MDFKDTQPELYLGKTNICTKQQQRDCSDDIIHTFEQIWSIMLLVSVLFKNLFFLI